MKLEDCKVGMRIRNQYGTWKIGSIHPGHMGNKVEAPLLCECLEHYMGFGVGHLDWLSPNTFSEVIELEVVW